ncbi:unnamed protein product, partial [Natator depressus]
AVFIQLLPQEEAFEPCRFLSTNKCLQSTSAWRIYRWRHQREKQGTLAPGSQDRRAQFGFYKVVAWSDVQEFQSPSPEDCFSENEKTLFNIHCKVQLLLESIKHCCGCENEGEIELADVSGQAKNLLQNQHCYASELLSEREICVLLSVTRGEGSSEVVFTPLLKDEGVINPKFLAKLWKWEDSKVSSTRVKSKKAGKKPTRLLEVPSPEATHNVATDQLCCVDLWRWPIFRRWHCWK